MESIDVEKIMEEIRQEISEKGYTSAMLSFQDVEEEVAENKTMEEYCDLLNTTWEIQAYRLLPQNGVMDRLKVFIKKVLRKSIKFYIEPIVHDQNMFNADNVRLLNLMNNYIKLTDQKIEMLEKELIELKKQINTK